jgi:hypothetical protein
MHDPSVEWASPVHPKGAKREEKPPNFLEIITQAGIVEWRYAPPRASVHRHRGALSTCKQLAYWTLLAKKPPRRRALSVFHQWQDLK